MHKIGLSTPKSAIAHSLEEAQQVQPTLGFPVIIRPSFTMGGSGGGASFEPNSCVKGASFEQESLRAAAENLWADVHATPASARFTVPHLNKVPSSLQAIEAESMRAAAAGLWGSCGSTPAAAPAPSEGGASLLGMPQFPPGAGGADELGLCAADLLAGLRLDAACETAGMTHQQ